MDLQKQNMFLNLGAHVSTTLYNRTCVFWERAMMVSNIFIFMTELNSRLINNSIMNKK